MDSERPRTDRVNEDGSYWCDCQGRCKGKITRIGRSQWYQHRPRKESTRLRMAQQNVARAERAYENREKKLDKQLKVQQPRPKTLVFQDPTRSTVSGLVRFFSL